jgi:excisionase family DNA binding protein
VSTGSIRDEAHRQGALTITEASQRLAVDGKDLIRAMREGRIRYVMVEGIAHIPEDALEEFRQLAS